jgi:hypothetical protein
MLTPSLQGGGQGTCPTRQRCMPVCREILSSTQLQLSHEVCRKATPDVALARGCPPVPGMCTRLVPAHAGRAKTGNTTGPFAGLLSKPSDGLEPSTPSLPWRFRGGTGGHRRALAITFLLQIVPSRRVSRARACPLVRGLMYPSRTRGVLSVLETDDAAGCRARRRVSFGLRIAYVPPAEPSNAGLCGCRSRAGHKSRGTVIGA